MRPDFQINNMKVLGVILFLVITCIKSLSQDIVNEVIIISTNDIHGSITGFSRMGAYVKELKKTHKDVFVFNGGDLINGNPVVDEAKEKGYPIFDLMNSIPYDVSCLGNHEFENGEAVLQQRLEQSFSVYVGANVSSGNNSPLKPIKPYYILKTTDGTSIAIIGLTANSSNPCVVKNVIISNPLKKAMEYQWLKDSSDVLIALTHIGYKADSILATQMPAIDIIVGGHSHTEIPHGIVVNGTLITQAGDKLRFLGKTTLKIKNHHITEKSFEMVDVSSLTTIDTIIQAKIDAYNSNTSFNKIVGLSTTSFTNKEAIGCLKTDALKETLHLDIAFDHVRNISFSHFPKGNILLGDIYSWDSYDYKTLRYNLNAAEIGQLITNSIKNVEEPVLFVSGIIYTVIKNFTGGLEQVIVKDQNGLLSESKTFSVGMNSFIACQFMKGINKPGRELSTTTADAVISYLQQHKKVDYSNAKRVFVR